MESSAKEIVGIHIAKNDCCGYYVAAQGSYSDASFIGA